MLSYRSRLSERLSSIRFYLAGILELSQSRQVFLCSQAVAFKVLITWVPIALLSTGFLGKILSFDRPYEAVRDFVVSSFPSYQSDRLVDFVEQLQRISGTLTLVGSITLIVAAISLFSTLRIVLSNVFKEEWHDQRPLLAGYAFDLQMILQVGALFVLTVAISFVVRSVDETGIAVLERLGLHYDWLRSGWARAGRLAGLTVPLLLTVGMFFQLYYFVPIPRPPKRSVLAGAATAAVLWEIGKHAFTSYAAGLDRFERWVSVVSSDRVALLGDTFGLIVAFVLWAYYTGLVLMIGALIVLLYWQRHRTRSTPGTAFQE
jgi:membrane protein